VAVSLAAAAAVLGLVFLLPAPLHTVGEGVVWLPEESFVRAGADGFVRRIIAVPGGTVKKDAPLIESEDPQLVGEITVGKARIAAAEVKVAEFEPSDRLQAGLARRELAIEQSALARAEDRAHGLIATSATQGVFILPTAEDTQSRFYRRGEVIGFVVPRDVRVARVLVNQGDIDLVRNHLRGARVVAATDLGRSAPARVLREVPAASDRLPSVAFATEGGGSKALDTRDPEHPRALSRSFQFDVEVPAEVATAAAGGHVWVRFDHGQEPIGLQWMRRLRQLFLSRFNA
jgi:putative peptide zinc metalloprotease protein